jgi:hypothetical protein
MTAGSEAAALRMPDAGRTNRPIHISFGEFSVELKDGWDPQSVFEVLRIIKAL